MVVWGCRAVEKDDGGAEVGSWLKWEVVGCCGRSGRVLKAVVWVFG